MPVFGMYPERDVQDGEVRRRERAERLHNPHGRQIDPRARAVGGWLLAIALAAIVVAVAWGWMSLPIPR